jgi:hypothetical protein
VEEEPDYAGSHAVQPVSFALSIVCAFYLRIQGVLIPDVRSKLHKSSIPIAAHIQERWNRRIADFR